MGNDGQAWSTDQEPGGTPRMQQFPQDKTPLLFQQKRCYLHTASAFWPCFLSVNDVNLVHLRLHLSVEVKPKSELKMSAPIYVSAQNPLLGGSDVCEPCTTGNY